MSDGMDGRLAGEIAVTRNGIRLKQSLPTEAGRPDGNGVKADGLVVFNGWGLEIGAVGVFAEPFAKGAIGGAGRQVGAEGGDGVLRRAGGDGFFELAREAVGFEGRSGDVG